uniref:Putative secreted protein synganglion overexpressed n=1 Tax=Rhipicephalus microplus TaxID=6941 RepID=A0A6M2D8A5_RHIMP
MFCFFFFFFYFLLSFYYQRGFTSSLQSSAVRLNIKDGEVTAMQLYPYIGLPGTSQHVRRNSDTMLAFHQSCKQILQYTHKEQIFYKNECRTEAVQSKFKRQHVARNHRQISCTYCPKICMTAKHRSRSYIASNTSYHDGYGRPRLCHSGKLKLLVFSKIA